MKKLTSKYREITTSVILVVGCLIFFGDSSIKDVTLLYPVNVQDSVSYDQGKIFLVSVAKESVNTLLVSTQWESTTYFDFTVPDGKDNFPKEFRKLFSPNTTIQKIWYSFKYQNLLSPPESVQYHYSDTVSIRGFWGTPQFETLMKEVKNPKTEHLLLVVRGWKDSVRTTDYDDPVADARLMYKLQLRLVNGLNTVYFARGGNKSEALEYTTTVVTDTRAFSDREGRFHFSALEANCTSCHEGLPSADSGKTMTATCQTCHKAIVGGPAIHAPAEMNECVSCHAWSAEKKSMAMLSAIPDKCFECHTEKKAYIDSAKVQHPVASECATCHAPHSSNQPHLLKADVFTLCTSCHPDRKMNHPVGKHPLRFATLTDGSEISCVSCHNPHGSEGEHLLNVAGGPMSICAKCHQ